MVNTPVPEDDEDVFDLDAEYAQKAQADEASGKRIPVKVEGEVFHFKPARDWSMRAMIQSSRDNDIEVLIEEMLDEDEAERFLELDVSQGKFERLMDEVEKRSGFGRGEGRRSSKSSKKRRKK